MRLLQKVPIIGKTAALFSNDWKIPLRKDPASPRPGHPVDIGALLYVLLMPVAGHSGQHESNLFAGPGTPIVIDAAEV